MGRKRKAERRAKEKQKEFMEAAKPLMKWMAENLHPHHRAIVDCTSAELLEGVCSNMTYEFLKD